jgi:hypothetical protein
MNSLLRFGRRRSSWELDDAGAIAAVEFRQGDGHDISPSAYEVDNGDADELRARTIRLYTEHAASFLGSPPNGIRPLDLSGLRPTAATAGGTAFQYANSCHRELRLTSDADLLRLVEQVKREIDRRSMPEVPASAMLDYASERLLAKDPEWLAATTPPRNASAWIRMIEKRRKKAAPLRQD